MLLEIIKNDSLAARKARDTDTATALVTLLAEASRVGKDDGNRDSTDEEVVRVLRKFIKGLDDSLAVLKDERVINRTRHEKALLECYLPRQLTPEALAGVIDTLVSKLPSKGARYMGQVMGQLRTNFAGTYDGTMASAMVKAALA